MKVDGWRYYNHAAIPTCAPHEETDTTVISNGEIWKMDGKPLLARWTEDFDCGYDTGWWYMLREAPFCIDSLSSKSRKHIRQSLKKCYVKQINAFENAEALYDCYCSAHERYKNSSSVIGFQAFKKSCANDLNSNSEYWAVYSIEDDLLLGYMVIIVFDNYVNISTTKLRSNHLSLRPSDALYCAVLGHYLNDMGKKYVFSGSRNINHKTNSEEYKISTFGYRKVYCKLCIKYNPKISFFVKMLFPFRKILRLGDFNTKIHMINSILLMEEISRIKK